MKTVNSIVFPSPQFAVLSETQLQDLHLAALEVLRRTGIRFHSRKFSTHSLMQHWMWALPSVPDLPFCFSH